MFLSIILLSNYSLHIQNKIFKKGKTTYYKFVAMALQYITFFLFRVYQKALRLPFGKSRQLIMCDVRTIIYFYTVLQLAGKGIQESRCEGWWEAHKVNRWVKVGGRDIKIHAASVGGPCFFVKYFSLLSFQQFIIQFRPVQKNLDFKQGR